MRKIPGYIIDESVRSQLAEINKNIDLLKNIHSVLIKKAKEKGMLKTEDRKLLKTII